MSLFDGHHVGKAAQWLDSVKKGPNDACRVADRDLETGKVSLATMAEAMRLGAALLPAVMPMTAEKI